LIRLSVLEKVNFVIDVQTLHDDFVLRSVKLSFKESQNASKSAMPNLLEWVRPNYRDKVYNWVQAHANAFYTGRECLESSLRGVKLHSPLGSAKTILAGEVIAAEMTDTLDGDGTNTPLDEQPEDDESGDGEMYMNIELRHLFAH